MNRDLRRPYRDEEEEIKVNELKKFVCYRYRSY